MQSPIDIVYQGPTATIVLNRPDVLNAFDPAMIAALYKAFTTLAAEDAVRVVVLTGAGSAFCAGGDMRWMRTSLDMTDAENLADASAMADMFDAAWTFPKPLIGRINGAAIGGGAGLVDLAHHRGWAERVQHPLGHHDAGFSRVDCLRHHGAPHAADHRDCTHAECARL